jgi:hypothetical protein
MTYAHRTRPSESILGGVQYSPALLEHKLRGTRRIRSSGLGLLLPWGSALTQSSPNRLYAYALPAAGILFTILLVVFHMAYFEAARFFYNEAARMERSLFDEGFRPIHAYHVHHAKLYNNLARKVFVLYAPFVLIGTFFLGAFLIDIFISNELA